MASSFIPTGIEQPDLIAIDKAGKPIKLLIVGFSIDGGKAVPITWPQAEGLPVYQRAGGQYRRFDLITGLVSGESFTSLAEVPK
jgi:hypothetical protein